jgi:hypothetical protein
VRLSDLFRSHVVDAGGETLGRVVDVLLVQDGPLLDAFGNALRVEGLLVGRRGLGTRLGYSRGGIRGPALLRRLFRAAEKGLPYVRWDQVASWDADAARVTLHVGADRLGRFPDDVPKAGP